MIEVTDGSTLCFMIVCLSVIIANEQKQDSELRLKREKSQLQTMNIINLLAAEGDSMNQVGETT